MNKQTLLSLSRTQAGIVRLIEMNCYRPTVMDGRSLRALIAKGVVIEKSGLPPSYELTAEAVAALKQARS